MLVIPKRTLVWCLAALAAMLTFPLAASASLAQEEGEGRALAESVQAGERTARSYRPRSSS